MGFWYFHPSEKWDELQDNKSRHLELLSGALGDKETGIEKYDRKGYIIYGEEEALLIRPTRFVIMLLLELYRIMIKHE